MSRRRSPAGVTLIELLVACVVANVALLAAFGWLFTAAAASHHLDEGAQARSIAAYSVRTLRDDLSQACSASLPPAIPPGAGISLEHHHPGEAAEPVLLVWDSSRRVLWRKTSSTYVADHVTAFALTFMTADGGVVAPNAGTLLPQSIKLVHIELTIGVGSGVRHVTADVPFRR